MVEQTLTVEKARPQDLAGVDALLAETYPKLLKADYPASVLVTAVPLIARANPRLLRSGTYYVARTDDAIVGAGGWTWAGRSGAAEVRHLVTSVTYLRCGIGTTLMQRIVQTAQYAGAQRLIAQATRTAVPFYRAMGFGVVGEIRVPLRPGIEFPAVTMTRSVALA